MFLIATLFQLSKELEVSFATASSLMQSPSIQAAINIPILEFFPGIFVD